ncbi:DUF1275 domain-containing protein [Nocardioides hwasunensis]|uniref:DUF1275 domain-containing protein n=2 Tax=Nocardioides hwasunensis TaxID=397258 RepID=A0ABR8ML79_9ACTN|nr:DUF1275 domain-containing protein [Nocardioides hwasunensis]
MLALTFSTGVADAVGYLALDKVFTGNMTGNVVILGMGVAGGADLPVVGPLVALVTFMLGAAAGGRAMRGRDRGWSGRAAFLIGLVGCLFGSGAVVFALVSVHEGSVLAYAMTGGLAAAMGLQAAVARRIAVADVTTVVVTSTITGLAADSRLGAGLEQPWLRRAGAIVLIGVGAAVGALLLSVATWLSVAVPAVLSIAVAVVGEVLVRRQRQVPQKV